MCRSSPFCVIRSLPNVCVTGLGPVQARHDEEGLLEFAEVGNSLAHSDHTVVRGIRPPRRAAVALVRCLLAFLASDNVPSTGQRRQAESHASHAGQRRPVPKGVAAGEGPAGVPVTAKAREADQLVVQDHVGCTGGGCDRSFWRGSSWLVRPQLPCSLELPRGRRRSEYPSPSGTPSCRSKCSTCTSGMP